MYATCLWCARPLGRNATIEAFPVGRRLAFDAAQGRLWVVCPSCERWNLTPLDTRWEAIEACERLFRGTRLRASTDQVGLARIVPPKGDGLELVRIGAPLRPEFAAWRYGDQFGRRRRRQLAVAGGLAVAGVAVYVGAAVFTKGLLLGGGIGGSLWKMARYGRQGAVVARIPSPDPHRPLIEVLRQHLRETRFERPEGDERLALSLLHRSERVRIAGAAAEHAAARLLPAANRLLGRADDVRHAVTRMERAGSATAFLAQSARHAAKLSHRARNAFDWRGTEWFDDPAYEPAGLLALDPSLRLALEMALHEEQERRAMEGELQELERAWREAEEIAAIADGLALPTGVEARLATLRGTRGRMGAVDGATAAPTREVALSDRNDGADRAG